MKYRDLGFLALLAVGVLACADDPAVPMEPSTPEGPGDPPPLRVDTTRIVGSLAKPASSGGNTCVYPWDFFGELSEPCKTELVTVPEAGYLVMQIDFEPVECSDYGGLWFSMFPLAGSYETYWAGCRPFNTSPCAAFVEGPGDYPVTVGLHATPDSWDPGHLAEYVLTVIFTSLGAGDTVTAPRTAAARCHGG